MSSHVTLNTNFQEIKFAASPFPAATNAATATAKIMATPITRAMEMNNWLQEHVHKVKFAENGLPAELNRMLAQTQKSLTEIRAQMEAYIEKISKAVGCDCPPQETASHPDVKSVQIRCMYYRMLEELLLTEERTSKGASIGSLLLTESFHKGVLVAATETTLFVHNSVTLMFEEILDLVDISAFDFWKLLPAFLRFDPSMPSPIVHHFGEIESKILELLAWQRRSPIYELISHMLSSEPHDSGQIRYAHERFFKKMLQLAATHIEEITHAMNLRNDTIKEKIWEAAKVCLSAETDLLIDRHVDQLILCGVYAVCKMEQSKERGAQSKKPPACKSYSFNDIVASYIGLNRTRGRVTNALFQSVKISEGRNGDIIEFYNTIYVPRMKSALSKLCLDPGWQPGASLETIAGRAKIGVLAPFSPLRQSLGDPQQSQGHSGRLGGAIRRVGGAAVAMTPSKFPASSPLVSRAMATPIMTPRTRKLFAYAESPAPQSHGGNSTPNFLDQPKKTYKNILMDQLLKQSMYRH